MSVLILHQLSQFAPTEHKPASIDLLAQLDLCDWECDYCLWQLEELGQAFDDYVDRYDEACQRRQALVEAVNASLADTPALAGVLP